MSWGLLIASPLDADGVSFKDTDASPVTIEHPECVVAANGDCVEMTLHVGRPDLLAVTPRGILYYDEGGTALFAGPAITLPSTDSRGAGPADRDADALQRVSVAGGRLLVEESTVGPFLWLDMAAIDAAEMAFKLCDKYAHPALTVSSGNFKNTGVTIPTWYAPTQQLSDALDDLVTISGDACGWWVDALLAVHFGCGGEAE